MMAKRNANFLDLHAEKIVLGVSGLVLVAALVYSFGGMRFKVDHKGPGDLLEEAGKQAEATAQAVARVQPSKLAPDAAKSGSQEGDPIKKLQDWFAGGAKSLVRLAGIQEKLGRTQRFPPLRTEITTVSSEARHDLVRLAPPGVPVVVADRTTLELTERKPIEEIARGGSPSETGGRPVVRSYVTVAAQIDLAEQETNLSLADYPPKTRLPIVRVHLQRMDEAEPWRGWQDVDTYLPFKPPERPPLIVDGRFKLDGLADFRKLIEDAASEIARTQLPSRRAQYPPVPWLDEAPPPEGTGKDDPSRRVKKWLDQAKKAMTGKKLVTQPDLDIACMLARAAAGEGGTTDKDIEESKKLLDDILTKMPKARRAYWEHPIRAPERLMPIMAHDLDAEPGRTYVYRMRYEVLNSYAGSPGELKNPKDAEVLTLVSGWSPPSRPVEPASDVVFFLTQAEPKKQDVSVSVHKKTRTGWKDQVYKIKVGEPIGQKEKLGPNKGVDFTTGVVCVEIDFDRLDPAPGGKKTVAMIYVDPADGKLHERYLTRDLKDKDKIVKRLGEQATAMR